MTSTSPVTYDTAYAPMRDGTVLRADVYRPPYGHGPWPVLLARCPYGRRDPGILARLAPATAARRCWLVVLQDTRGRFGSDGAWEPLAHEYDDGHDTVRWAAGLPGSDGRVAMYGPSYLGHAQWAAIEAAPPELVAAVPEFTWSDPADGLLARGAPANSACPSSGRSAWVTRSCAAGTRPTRSGGAPHSRNSPAPRGSCVPGTGTSRRRTRWACPSPADSAPRHPAPFPPTIRRCGPSPRSPSRAGTTRSSRAASTTTPPPVPRATAPP